MYVNKRIGAVKLVSAQAPVLLLLLLVVSGTTVLYLELLRGQVAIAPSVLGGLGTAISIFLAFLTAQGYDRWWEARKIWGTMTNDSRSFGRLVMTLFAHGDDPVTVHEMQGRLIRRHIAFLYAVRDDLRREQTGEYLRHIGAEDRARVGGLTHPGNGLLQLQGAEIDAAERNGHLDVIRMAQLNDMLNRFSTSMGMAERIKSTVFPGYYASLVRVAIWALLLLFPMALGEQIGYRAIPYAFGLGALFMLVFLAGESLMDPFEGRPNDTPLSTIIRTVEINLLEQIGASDVPAPLEPVDGKYLL